MSEQQIAEIELNIKEAEELVKLGRALDRLHANRDFKKVIVEGYFKDEAVRLVNLKGDPNMQREEHQAAIVKDIDAIGGLRNFFGKLYQQADLAASAIADGEDAIEEIRSEGDE